MKNSFLLIKFAIVLNKLINKCKIIKIILCDKIKIIGVIKLLKTSDSGEILEYICCIQPINTCMTCVIEFNTTTTCMIVYKINAHMLWYYLFVVWMTWYNRCILEFLQIQASKISKQAMLN